MTNSTLIILGAVLASPFLGVLAANIFGKKKSDAEAKATNIGGEVSIGDYGLRVAERNERDLESLRLRFDELEKKFETMKAEKDNLTLANIEKDRRIKDLEGRVDELEKELERYHQLENKVTEVVNAVKPDILKS